jgi:hypothetical protein
MALMKAGIAPSLIHAMIGMTCHFRQHRLLLSGGVQCCFTKLPSSMWLACRRGLRWYDVDKTIQKSRHARRSI